MLRVNSHPKYGLLQLEMFNYVNDIFRLKFTQKKIQHFQKKTEIAWIPWIDSPTPILTPLLLRLAMFLRINMDFNECLVVSIAIFSRNLNKVNEL